MQGVFFRASTQAEARRLGLVGTVRNVGDDEVHVLAQGDDAAVDALVAWLGHGPPRARVDRLTVEPARVDPDARSFEVVR